MGDATIVSGGRRGAPNHSPVIRSPAKSRVPLGKQVLEDRLGAGYRYPIRAEEGHFVNRIDINSYLPVARAGAVAREVGKRPAAKLQAASGKQVIHLAAGVAARIGQGVLDRRVILVQNAQRQIDAGNGVVNLPIEYSVSPADHGLMIVGGVPCKRHTRRKVVPGRPQRKVLRVQFIADAVSEREV